MGNNVINRMKENVNVNGVLLSFNYCGETNEIDETKMAVIDDLINKFTFNLNHNDICRDVRFLRTIFRDYPLIKLSVTYNNGNSMEKVELDCSDCLSYEYWIEKKSNELIKCISFEGDLNKLHGLLIAISSDKGISKDGLDPIEIDENKSEIIEAYRLFYGENPDFADKNINLSCQAMISMLKFLDYCTFFQYWDSIVMHENNDSDPWSKYNYPTSHYLQEDVMELFPFGVVTEDIDAVSYGEKDFIFEVGKIVREYIGQYQNEEIALLNLIKLLFASKDGINDFYSESRKKELENKTKIPSSVIDSTYMMLVRTRKVDIE